MLQFTSTSHSPCSVDDAVGFIQTFLDPSDERPAAEQIDANYGHGGGWRPIGKFTLEADGTLNYPDDEPLKPWATATLRNERINVYPYGLTAIIQPDGSFAVSRLD